MRHWITGLMFVVAVVGAQAQMTAQKVVANSLAASGGAAQYAAVTSLSFSGHLDLGHGQTAPISVWWMGQPDRIRIEITMGQGRLIQIWDGTQAWQVAPGAAQAEPLQGEPAKSLADQAMNGVALMAVPGVKKTLAGAGTLAGHDYYKVVLTLPNGDAFTQYFDSRTWRVFHEEFPGGVEDIKDYRKVGPLTLPFEFDSGPAGQPQTRLVREDIQLNPKLPASLFVKP